MITFADAKWLASTGLPADTAAVLLCYDGERCGVKQGRFYAFTKADLASQEVAGLCGVRGQAVVVVDPTLSEDALLHLKASITAGLLTTRRRVRRASQTPVRIIGYGWSGYTHETTLSRVPERGEEIAANVWRTDDHQTRYVVAGRVLGKDGVYTLYVEEPEALDDDRALRAYYAGFATD